MKGTAILYADESDDEKAMIAADVKAVTAL
jgi:hypothetical protein